MQMPKERRSTLSDDPVERRVYESASKDELPFIIETLVRLLAPMRTPRGWHKQGKPGRPPKKRRGRREEHGWRACVIALVVKEYLELSYREMASFLAASPDLVTRMGFTRAPSHSTLNRAFRKLPPQWIKKLNDRVLSKAKGGPGVVLPSPG